MPDSAVNPPDSPPHSPVIPQGFATRLGQLGTLVLSIAAVLQPFVADAQHENSNAKFFAALATAVAVATILGRMLQAAAAYRDAPSPSQLADDFGDPDLDASYPHADDAFREAPGEESLRSTFPEDAPLDRPTTGGKFGETA